MPKRVYGRHGDDVYTPSFVTRGSVRPLDSPEHRQERRLPNEPYLQRVMTVTRKVFGRSVNPHLFRDCVATSMAMNFPEDVRITAPVLGYRSIAIQERNYNQAGSYHAAL